MGYEEVPEHRLQSLHQGRHQVGWAVVEDDDAVAESCRSPLPAADDADDLGADEPDEMYHQAREICSWGKNVYVKIPVTNTRGESTAQVARRLSQEGVQVNVTAVFTIDQVSKTVAALEGGAASVISVFAGRIADTGRDPVPHMKAAVKAASHVPTVEVLWASPREVLNLYQADAAGCQIITMTADLLAKVQLRGKDLLDYSRETVRMFHSDAQSLGEILTRHRERKAA